MIHAKLGSLLGDLLLATVVILVRNVHEGVHNEEVAPIAFVSIEKVTLEGVPRCRGSLLPFDEPSIANKVGHLILETLNGGSPSIIHPHHIKEHTLCGDLETSNANLTFIVHNLIEGTLIYPLALAVTRVSTYYSQLTITMTIL